MSDVVAAQVALMVYAQKLKASVDSQQRERGDHLMDALDIGVHDGHEAELVLAAIGVRNPDAVSRILDKEVEDGDDGESQ